MHLTDKLLYVCQAQAEAFHIMAVSGGHAIEFLEYLFQILLADTYAVVGNGDLEVVLRYIFGLNSDIQRLVFTAIFHGVVKQIEYHICEVHFIHIYYRILSVKIGGD